MVHSFKTSFATCSYELRLSDYLFIHANSVTFAKKQIGNPTNINTEIELTSYIHEKSIVVGLEI